MFYILFCRFKFFLWFLTNEKLLNEQSLSLFSEKNMDYNLSRVKEEVDEEKIDTETMFLPSLSAGSQEDQRRK